MPTTLDTTYTAVRVRWDAAAKTGKPEPWLTAAFYVVEMLSPAQCEAIVIEAYGRPLVSIDADIVQHCIARLQLAVAWRHVALAGDAWLDGRGE